MIEDYDNKKTETKGKLVFSEFKKVVYILIVKKLHFLHKLYSYFQLCSDLKAGEVASSFKQVVSKKENLETLGGMSDASSEGTTHSVRLEEQLAFSDWINSNLSVDPDLKHLLPIESEGKNLYEKVKDGILLW